jgi:4-hydroxy-3-methylbut-2-enyl diphosphate reductase
MAELYPARPEPVPAGTIPVAGAIHGPDGPAPCPAADLLVGELRRAGRAAALVPFTPDPAGPAAAATLAGAHGPVGLGVGSVPGGPDPTELLAGWLAVAGPRTVLLAAPRSFCAGVERAIEVVEQALTHRTGPIYVRKQIVHNTHVVNDLAGRGAIFVDELDEVPDAATVVFSAHGVSPAVRAEADRRRLDVIDASCPLVTKVHAEARRFAGRGDTVVLIGHAGHEEVEGTLGEAPEQTVLVQSAEEVAALELPDPERVSYLTQTTLAMDETTEVIDALRQRFPAARGPASDDICYATTNRQDALAAIATDADLVLVVGSANSSNSVRLVELARRAGTPAHLIDGPGDIDRSWLAGAAVIGLTAGASAPPHLVEAVVATLAGLGPVTVAERETTRETIHFAPPRSVWRTGSAQPTEESEEFA